MDLQIDSDDARLLERILDRALGNLRQEIAGTENLDWRNALHADENRMKALIERLRSAAQTR